MSVRCEQSGGHGAGAGVMGFAHAPGGEQSALSQGPPLGLSPTPRPSPLSTRWRGRGGGQGGLEFVIPGRVCRRNAGPGIGGKRWLEEEGHSLGVQRHKP